jgi:hypothetical protein
VVEEVNYRDICQLVLLVIIPGFYKLFPATAIYPAAAVPLSNRALGRQLRTERNWWIASFALVAWLLVCLTNKWLDRHMPSEERRAGKKEADVEKKKEADVEKKNTAADTVVGEEPMANSAPSGTIELSDLRQRKPVATAAKE